MVVSLGVKEKNGATNGKEVKGRSKTSPRLFNDLSIVELGSKGR